MIKLSNFEIITPKHPVEGVNLYSWSIYNSWKYGIDIHSHYHFKSVQEARKDWEHFAELNGLSNWKYYSDKQSVQDVRTKSGTFI